MDIFTKREKIVLAVSSVVYLLVMLFPDILTDINEYIYLIFIVIPLGILVATDKERIDRMK